ncbi:hypothetical protein QUF82_09340 [Thiotrichales bacterium HSG14]|nr:hypothetical protein [Thiotrichales bacterium HSG14]
MHIPKKEIKCLMLFDYQVFLVTVKSKSETRTSETRASRLYILREFGRDVMLASFA